MLIFQALHTQLTKQASRVGLTACKFPKRLNPAKNSMQDKTKNTSNTFKHPETKTTTAIVLKRIAYIEERTNYRLLSALLNVWVVQIKAQLIKHVILNYIKSQTYT